MAKKIHPGVNIAGPETAEVLTPKEKFAKLIEVYKAQNPEKYKQKEAALKKQLDSL